jgi:hypothetical protein
MDTESVAAPTAVDNDETALSLVRANEAEEPEDEDGEEADDWGSDAASHLTPAEATSAADRREIDQLTERIFSAVLSRYGWEQHGDRIEHVGEVRRRR